MSKKRDIGQEILEALQDIKQGKGKRKVIEGFEDVSRVRHELHLSQAAFSGCVASVREGYNFKEYGRILDMLRHQICKIVERRLASSLTKNLSFLNHANIFNS